MLKFMLPVVLSTGFAMPIADGVPTLAFEPSCREAARADPLKQVTAEACFKQETEARDELKKSWDTFSAGDRTHCLNLTRIGNMPSKTPSATLPPNAAVPWSRARPILFAPDAPKTRTSRRS